MVPLTCLLVFNSRSREWMYAWLLVILFCTATLGPSTVVVGRTDALPPILAGLYNGADADTSAVPQWSAAVMPALAPRPPRHVFTDAGTVVGARMGGDGADTEATATDARPAPPMYDAGLTPGMRAVEGSAPAGSPPPVSSLPVGYSCSPQDVEALQCTNASLLSPSWCRYQNPMIVPRPPLSLNKRHESLATYQRRYRCVTNDAFADCDYIRRFVPIEMTTPNNASRKLIVVASRTDGSTRTGSTVQALDEDFNTAVDVTANSPFPGVTSVLQVGSNRNNPAQKYMVYGGNVHTQAAAWTGGLATCAAGGKPGSAASLARGRGRGNASPLRFSEASVQPTPSPPATCNDAGERGCSSFVFVAFTAHDGGPVTSQPLGAAGSPCFTVVDSAFFHLGDEPMFAALQHNPTSGDWVIEFFGLKAGSGKAAGDEFELAATWTLLADGEPPAPPDDEPLTFEMVYQYSQCDPHRRSKKYALGGFFTRQLCQETPLVVVAGLRRVSAFKFVAADSTVDVKTDSLALLFETHPGMHVVDVAAFGEQIPPVDFSNTNLTTALHTASQALWLAVAVDKDGAAIKSQVHVVALPEFGYSQLDVSTAPVTNPADLPDAALACGVMEYYDRPTDACVAREYSTPFSSSTVELRQLEVRWRDIPAQLKQQFAAIDCAPTDFACITAYVERTQKMAGSLPFQQLFLPQHQSPQQTVMEYVHKAYGLRHNLYASTTQQTLLVFQALHLPEPCQQSMGGRSMVVSQVNELSMMGDVNYFSVTPNGQYVFSAVSRPKYFLASMERLVLTCDTLAKSPDNQFLAAWKPACASTPAPRLPNVADFLQIASSCVTGTYCGSFLSEEVQRVPDGSYSNFFFDLQLCDPGHFCMQGVRQQCPTGFVCPAHGTVTPVLCGNDRSNNYNCYPEGLERPYLCPNGTICGVPYVPAIPSPPGLAMEITTSTVESEVMAREGVMLELPQRTVTACGAGEWCGLGRSVEEGSALLCPPDTYCEDSQVLQPTICNMGGACTRDNCTGNAPYCPAGTSAEIRCPKGHYCETPDDIAPCAASLYCPAGSGIWQTCPAQYYCPDDGSEKIVCPDGYFCNEGVNAPTKCNLLSDCHCEGGCAEPHNYMSIPVLVLVPLGLWLGFWLFQYYNRKRLARRDKRHAQMRQMMRIKRNGRGGRGRAGTGFSSLDLSDNGSVSPVPTAGGGVSIELGNMTPGLKKNLLSSTNFDGDHEAKLEAGVVTGVVSPARDGQVSFDMSAYGEVLGDDELGLTTKEFTVDIECRNLGLKLKSSGKMVLDGVNGCIRNSRVLAVLGPSGAGKTTFCSALADKAPYGKRLGKVFINGVERSLSEYSTRVGFVPQEDIMLRTQTVEETLKHCAATRLPPSWSDAKRHAFVDSTLGLLGLRDIRHNVIGDETERGISGGQRKRVNIGMELVADPTVLFLDEPTSGLDANSSMEVCTALRRIAELGITIITVIHQPRFEVFRCFHDVLLLGRGGKTVYFGESKGALPYFQDLGFKCPPMTNPPDFMLDIISGDFPAEFLEAHPGVSTSTFLFDKWRTHERENKLVEDLISTTGDQPPHRATAGLLRLTILSLKRAILQHSRTKRNLAIDQVLVFIAAVFISSVYWGDTWYSPPLPKQVFQGCQSSVAKECQLGTSVMTDTITQRGSMIGIAMSLTAVASMIRVFGSERVVYWREAQTLPQPRHTIAYFLGKDISMIPSMLLAPMFFAVIFLSVTTPRGSFAMYYWILLALQFTATSVGYLVSVTAPPAMAQLVGVVMVFSSAMFAGGMPTLKQLYGKIPPLCWLPYISYNRYALEALYVGEIVEYQDIVELQGVDLAAQTYDTFGYRLDAYSRDVAIMFAFGVVFRLLAVLVMIVKDRDKKR